MGIFTNLKGAFKEMSSSEYKTLAWLKLKLSMFFSKLTSKLGKKTKSDYLKMQNKQYELAASVAKVEQGKLEGDCVAAIDWNLQNDWEDYEKYLFNKVTNKKYKKALEYGCGPGRNIISWWDKFDRIDGVDISTKNLENAKTLVSGIIPNDRFPNFYLTEGQNTGDAPSDFYDFCFSVICLQHIAVWEVRYSIFESLYRCLKSGGLLGFQMGYGQDNKGTVPYFDNHYNAGVTNGGCDVRVENPEQIAGDLKKIGFKKVEFHIAPTIPEISSVFREFIYVTAEK